MQASMCSSSTVWSLVPAVSQGSSKDMGPVTCASSRISITGEICGDLQASSSVSCCAMLPGDRTG